MIPVLAYFISVSVLPSGHCTSACKAFLALCDIVDLLQAVPLGVTTPGRLRSTIRLFMERCEASGWVDRMTPKFHWPIHFPNNLERWGATPSCWVHERKHKLVKRFANDVSNTTSFSLSVMSEVVTKQLHEITGPDMFDMSYRLLDEHDAPKDVKAFLTA